MAVGRWKGVIGSVISPVEGSSLFYYFITTRMGQVLRATSGWANDGTSVYLSFVFEYFLLIFLVGHADAVWLSCTDDCLVLHCYDGSCHCYALLLQM